MDELIKIIGATCLSHYDSGETSCNREARLILQALADNGYKIVKNSLQSDIVGNKVNLNGNKKDGEAALPSDDDWKNFEHECFMNCKLEDYDNGNLRKAIFRWIKENYELPKARQ